MHEAFRELIVVFASFEGTESDDLVIRINLIRNYSILSSIQPQFQAIRFSLLQFCSIERLIRLTSASKGALFPEGRTRPRSRRCRQIRAWRPFATASS